MLEKLIASNKIEYHNCSTSYSMWQRDQAVSISRETDDSESNFQPCKGKPNIHAWSTVVSLPSNRLLLIPVHGSGPLSPTTGNHHIPTPMVLCNINKILSLRESGGVCPFAGTISYYACPVPYLRHVASTFKCLTTATTHCNLIKIINTDGLQQIRP